MLAVRNSLAGSLKSKSGRTPLQPRNSIVENIPYETSGKGSKCKGLLLDVDWNKENNNPGMKMELLVMDLSLEEELIEMRKRTERLRVDKKKTEEKLKQKDAMLELWKKDMDRRGEEQIQLEIEMDRVYRINELKALTTISPIKSLREKEEKKAVKAPPLSILKWDEDDIEESVGENSVGSPAGSSQTSGIVAPKN